MFLPPEQRHPGSSPGDPPPPEPASPRGETLGLWLIGLALVSIVLAPLGGSTLLEALWHVLHR